VFICHIFIDVNNKFYCCRLFVCIDANKTKVSLTTPALSILDCISLHYQVHCERSVTIINIAISRLCHKQHVFISVSFRCPTTYFLYLSFSEAFQPPFPFCPLSSLSYPSVLFLELHMVRCTHFMHY